MVDVTTNILPITPSDIPARLYNFFAKTLASRGLEVSLNEFGKDDIVKLCQGAGSSKEKMELRQLVKQLTGELVAELIQDTWTTEGMAQGRESIIGHCGDLEYWKEDRRSEVCSETQYLQKHLVPTSFVGKGGWDDDEKAGEEVSEDDWTRWSEWVDSLADADFDHLSTSLTQLGGPPPTWTQEFAACNLLLESFQQVASDWGSQVSKLLSQQDIQAAESQLASNVTAGKAKRVRES